MECGEKGEQVYPTYPIEESFIDQARELWLGGKSEILGTMNNKVSLEVMPLASVCLCLWK